MTDPLVITPSDIAAFMQCRRQYTWSDWRIPEPITGAAALGRRVHAAIEEHYRTGADPIDAHEALWKLDMSRASAPWDEDKLYEEIIIGRNCAAGFKHWLEDTAADAPFEVAGVEQTIEAPFLDGRVLLRGKVDVLFRRLDNGLLCVNDNKTIGRSHSVMVPRFSKSWQHFVYSLIMHLLGEEIGEAYYTTIRKAARPGSLKDPMVQRFSVPGSTVIRQHRVDQVKAICEVMLRLAAVDPVNDPRVYPEPGDHCAWCDYRKPCELAEDSLPAAQGLLDSGTLYVRGSRHERYEAV